MKNLRFLIVLFAFAVLVFQSCSLNDSALEGSSGEGTGGSLARFTIANNYLFTVDQTDLNVFDLSEAESPELKIKKSVGFEPETIFPLGDRLFLGTTTGMSVYDISNPESPRQISFYDHVYSCDPVVSDGNYVYVTLNSNNTTCWRSVNELHILDLENIESPELVKIYPMGGPQGLAIKNDTLWVCDNGLKIFDVSDKSNIKELFHFTDVAASDIILHENRALVIGNNGFVQYRLIQNSIQKISEIVVEN